ncbi:UNVERIFIED_CONTAM: exo-alpha-sialidase [Pseudomonas sp. CM11]
MDRRCFLISAGIVATFCSIPLIRRSTPPRPLVINNAYSLWYNRPAVAEIFSGFCIGYINSTGDVLVSEVSDQLLIGRTAKLHTFEGASDHGSPSLVRVPSGKYSGHIIACFSNHSSPLYFARTTRRGTMREWSAVRVIDGGRSTYASLAALPSGEVVLMHTLQEKVGKHSSGEWRKVVARTSVDGGDTWSEPVVIAGIGAGTFPYSTPLAVSNGGRCAMTYAIYSAAEKRHQGLTVVVTADAFHTKLEIPIDLGVSALADTVPFETKWVSESVVSVSYTQMSDGGNAGVSRVILVDVKNQKCLSNEEIADVAMHTYAGGSAITADGRSAIYSPRAGGLVRKDLTTGHIVELVESGNFSSPALVNLNDQFLLVSLKNPLIKTTRNFSGEIFIMPVPA